MVNDGKILETAENVNVIKSGFRKFIVNAHVMAQSPINKDSDLDELLTESIETIDSICPQDNVQLMLASQMTSIHNLQQKIMGYTVNTTMVDHVVKLGNLVAKLSNVFVQQVQLLNTLQNSEENKVIFEHVHIHGGAQAIVGTVSASCSDKGNNK